MAYAGVRRAELASRIGYSEATLDRMTGRRAGTPRDVDWRVLWKIADACAIPREWFTADIDRLWEIVPEGMPVFVNRARREAAAEASRLAEAAAQRRESSSTRSDEARGRRDARRRSP
jgi:hypothetical protein